jgi:plastocyanin
MKRILLVAGVVAAAVIVVIVVTGHKSSPSTATVSSRPSPTISASQTASAATITYGKNGFSPATTTVKSGDSVTFANNSSEDIQVDSDPHPVHTDDTDLNVGMISPGQSQTVVLTKKGTFGFHNHLDPSDTASITIQ